MAAPLCAHKGEAWRSKARPQCLPPCLADYVRPKNIQSPIWKHCSKRDKSHRLSGEGAGRGWWGKGREKPCSRPATRAQRPQLKKQVLLAPLLKATAQRTGVAPSSSGNQWSSSPCALMQKQPHTMSHHTPHQSTAQELGLPERLFPLLPGAGQAAALSPSYAPGVPLICLTSSFCMWSDYGTGKTKQPLTYLHNPLPKRVF